MNGGGRAGAGPQRGASPSSRGASDYLGSRAWAPQEAVGALPAEPEVAATLPGSAGWAAEAAALSASERRAGRAGVRGARVEGEVLPAPEGVRRPPCLCAARLEPALPRGGEAAGHPARAALEGAPGGPPRCKGFRGVDRGWSHRPGRGPGIVRAGRARSGCAERSPRGVSGGAAPSRTPPAGPD